MYMVTAHVISAYANVSYTTFVSDRIFKPLNMSSTTYFPSQAVASGRMTQSWTKTGRRIPQWFTDDVVGLNAGPGGVISNVVDLVSRNFKARPITSDIDLLGSSRPNGCCSGWAPTAKRLYRSK